MVLLFLFEREPMILTFLIRGLAVGVEFVHALIPRIGQKFDAGRQSQTTVFEQGKIMGFARTNRDTQNLLRSVVNYDLSFLGVAFFLAGVTPALFFWGARHAAHWRPPQSP